MRKPKQPDLAALDEIIDEVTAEAGTDDAQIWRRGSEQISDLVQTRK